MHQNKKTAFPVLLSSLILLFTSLLVSSCASVIVPKNYVPDSKVVFLMQDTSFGPIRYERTAADPYVFDSDTSEVDEVNPRFLKEARFETLLNADYRADSRLYREVAAHFTYMLNLPLFVELRPLLDSADIRKPVPLAANKGEKIQDYNNGAEYWYPDVPDAKITILNSGLYMIHFADKSLFQWQSDGVYFWKDASAATVQQYDPSIDYIQVKEGDVTYISSKNFRSYKGPSGLLEFNTMGDSQYNLTPAGKGSALYTYFVDKNGAVISCSVKTATGIRFDYFPEDRSMLAISGNQSVTIKEDFQKYHSVFDTKEHKATDILSYYLPQGIRLTNLDTQEIPYADINPVWPEQYKMKSIGPFDVWYTTKDEALLACIKSDRLADLESRVRSLSGLNGAKRRSIVIPPDLNSYRKLHATAPGEMIEWYPSGFQTLDYITMWPLSVPRYDQSAGQDYFFSQELYEIIAHEYVHVLVGENAGLLGRPPVWLNEGLAVYVECQLFPEAKAYWETTFAVSRDLRKFLSWDDITEKSTGEYPIARARVHYAQSYGMVSRLSAKYGVEKVASYVKSFRVKSSEASKVDLVAVYKVNFQKTFGVPWDDKAEILKSVPVVKK